MEKTNDVLYEAVRFRGLLTLDKIFDECYSKFNTAKL